MNWWLLQLSYDNGLYQNRFIALAYQSDFNKLYTEFKKRSRIICMSCNCQYMYVKLNLYRLLCNLLVIYLNIASVLKQLFLIILTVS